MRVGIVLPSVKGREAVYERVLEAFEETRPTGWEFDIATPMNYPTVGEAWNAGAEQVDGDYLFFAVDDAEPHDDWCQVAARTVDAGFLPAPRFEFADGTLEACGSMGFGQLLPECADRTPCRNTPIFFIHSSWWETVGEFLPVHYATDDDWTWRACLHGHVALYRAGMRFTHHHELAATQHVRQRAQEHINEFIRHAATLQLPEKLIPA